MADKLAALVSSFDATGVMSERRDQSDLSSADVSPVVFVERASIGRLNTIDAEWRDLLTRALEPNVFMDPALLRSANAIASGQDVSVLLAWDARHGSDERLIGVWAFAIGRSLIPIRILQAPAAPHSYLATPVVDRACCDAVLIAMLDFLCASNDLPNIIALTAASADGATMTALKRIVAERKASLRVFSTRQRPILLPGGVCKSYFEAAMSASSRKKLRQHRRRLAEKGNLQFRAFMMPAEIGSALEEFLNLEASGWKGRAGDALACSPHEAAFARAMISALAARNDAWIYGLYLDDKPVSMQVVLRSGAVAYTWKTAYDETLHDFSPGMLLLEDYTTAFLADRSIERVDSCSFDDSGFMGAWRDRETLGDLWLDASRGGSVGFSALAKAQHTAVLLRGRIKTFYNTRLKRWKRLRF